MSTKRQRQKLSQKFLKEKGFYKGEIDGLWGRKSEAALLSYESRNNPAPKVGKLAPPASDFHSVSKVFGRPGDESNLTRIRFPYPMCLAWDKDEVVKTSRCHKLIKKPLEAALGELLEVFGMDWIREHGLDLFGGIYNFRKVRGGRATSKHSWGIAIDLNPEKNGLRTPWKNGKQGARGYATMPLAAIKIFEKYGFMSAAREWGRDAMHFQFTQ